MLVWGQKYCVVNVIPVCLLLNDLSHSSYLHDLYYETQKILEQASDNSGISQKGRIF